MTSIMAQQKTKLDLELFPGEQFKIDKKIQILNLTLKGLSIDILLVLVKSKGRDFDALPSEEDTISFLRDLGHTGLINSLNDVVIDQMHQPWRNFAALINRSLSGEDLLLCNKTCLS
ncbi:hypothetical protein Tco_0780162 [Tanacetum coccineum]